MSEPVDIAKLHPFPWTSSHNDDGQYLNDANGGPFLRMNRPDGVTLLEFIANAANAYAAAPHAAAVSRLVVAAEARLTVWTRETYVEMEEAFKAVKEQQPCTKT